MIGGGKRGRGGTGERRERRERATAQGSCRGADEDGEHVHAGYTSLLLPLHAHHMSYMYVCISDPPLCFFHTPKHRVA